jgi:hypothetical protein
MAETLPVVDVPGRIRGHKKLTDPPPEVEVETGAGIVLPAHVVFSPGVMAVRLQVYELLAEQRLPLDGDGPAAPPEGERGVCWGCGVKGDWPVGPGTRAIAARSGWLIQRFGGNWMPEVWCPACVAMGGFGCVEEGAA